jgi:hypothetical protein
VHCLSHSSHNLVRAQKLYTESRAASDFDHHWYRKRLVGSIKVFRSRPYEQECRVETGKRGQAGQGGYVLELRLKQPMQPTTYLPDTSYPINPNQAQKATQQGHLLGARLSVKAKCMVELSRRRGKWFPVIFYTRLAQVA